MKTSPATRPCAEFPCDNPSLLANYGRGSEHTGAPPEVASGYEDADRAADQSRDYSDDHTDDPAGSRTNEFDWAATEYWVKEVKRRWSVAKADAPEVNFPVLDPFGLEMIVAAHNPAPGEIGDEAIALEESVWLTESGVMLGELLVMPSETLFDEDEHVFTASALGLDLVEIGEPTSEGAPTLDTFALIESGEVPIVEESGIEGVFVELSLDEHADPFPDLLDDEPDPFIEELLSLLPPEGNASGSPGVTPLCAPDQELVETPSDESNQVRPLPAVAASNVPEPPALSELFVMPRGVQPLVPLQLELTPTPAALSPWSELTGAISRHLMNSGHTRAAALVGPLLCGELVDFGRVEAGAAERLVCDGIAEVRGGRTVTTAMFRHSAKAFREEFGTGGLDTSEALFWLSQLLVALCGGNADEETLEAELRDLGVAKLLEWAA